MFTGIVEATGRILDRRGSGPDRRLTIGSGDLGLGDVRIGDSISVSGVCLSVVALGEARFCADVSAETLACTTLGELRAGDQVNLEKALLPTTRLGGHLVSGHVDGVGQVASVAPVGASRVVDVRVPPRLGRYLAAKGSVCVDGVSLTINAVGDAAFEVNIIPHTWERTTIGAWREGTAVNIEIDVVARYLERLLDPRLRGADAPVDAGHPKMDGTR